MSSYSPSLASIVQAIELLASALQQPAAIPLYRGMCPRTGDHFYTTSRAEMDAAIAQYGYQDEGIACYVKAQP